MKFYTIALLLATASSNQQSLDNMKSNLVNGITSDNNQVTADQTGLAAEEAKLREIENNTTYEKPV